MENQVSQNQPMRKHHSFLHKAVFFLVVTVVLIFALWIVNTYIFSQSSGYQAVFLTNGDVYFGHLQRKIGSQYVTLTDVYYLQIGDASDSADGEAATQSSQFSLIKLGKEIHGPKDAMLINRDHIMFIENLRDDSQVVQTISSR